MRRWLAAAAGPALAAAALFCALRPFVPSLPDEGLDAAWVSTLGELADRGAAWGRDVAFTYGPASPIVTRYLNGAYLGATIPVDLALAASFGAAAALLLAGRRGPGGAGAALALLVALVGQGQVPDGFFVALPFALLLLALRPGRGPAAAAAAGAFAAGLAALSKSTFPLAALPLALLGDALALSRRRAPPLTAPLLLGAAAGAALYGAGLPGPLALQAEVVAGYAAAMGRAGPLPDLALFLLAAGALLALAARAGAGRERAAAALGLAWACFVLLKAGFVRHDAHSLIAWRGLALLAALLAAGRLGPRAAGAAVALAVAVVAAYAPALGLRGAGAPAGLRAVVEADAGLLADGAEQARAAWRLARDPAGAAAEARAAKARAFADIAAASPLGALPGPVDALPSVGTRVMAAGLDYRPRPSFAEYGTYTEALAAANRAFLEGPRAPRWFLFGPEPDLGAMTVDGRYPNLAEGALWPDLLSLYRPDHRIGPLLALERRPAPAPLPLGPARTLDVPLGAEVPVDGGAPVWATVDVRPSPLGRLAAILLRPPAVDLALRFADGGERSFRLVPALGRAGFLLSPVVESASDFALLAAGRAAAPGRRVVGMRVAASPAAARFYAAAAQVELRALDVSALGGAAPPASEGTAWDRLAAAVPGAMLEDGERVAATAPAALAIPAEGLRRASLLYGVEDEAWRREGSAGACFALRAVGGAELWRRCLDPAGDPADRGPHLAAVDLPADATELELRTTCRTSCAAAWSYWGKPAAADP